MDRKDLASGRFEDVCWVVRTGSTNDDLAAESPAEPLRPRVLIADEQTAGRGRLDRRWEMEPGGGLMISFFVPWTSQESLHLVPIALGVAMVSAIEATGRPASLKWPNDIVVPSSWPGPLASKKLGGMLSSSVMSSGSLAGVVAGLGCNVNWPPVGFAELPDAVALAHLDGQPVTTNLLAGELIRQFDVELAGVASRGSGSLLERYRNRCDTIGQQVRVESAGKVIVGRATDIDPTGALLLEVAHRHKRIDVGDVVHLRPEQQLPDQSE